MQGAAFLQLPWRCVHLCPEGGLAGPPEDSTRAASVSSATSSP